MKRPFLASATGFTLMLTATIIAPLSAAPQPATDLKSQLAAAREVGERESAAEILRRLHAAAPEDIDTLKALIRAELVVGNTEEARVLVARLEDSVSADDAGLLEFQGDLFLRAEKSSDAVRAWQAALKGDPKNVSLLSKLALHFLHKEKNPATASTYFERLLPLRAYSSDHIQVAKVAIALRDWTVLIERTAVLKTKFSNDSSAKGMVPAFERIIHSTTRISELDALEKTAENPVPVILTRGRLFLDQGFPELALADARRALKLAPNLLHVRFHYAAAASRIWEDSEKIAKWGIDHYRYRRTAPALSFLNAMEGFDAVLYDTPDDPAALIGRGDLLYENHQEKLAKIDAERILNSNPDHPQGLRLLSMIHARDGYFGKAVKAVDRARALSPDDGRILSAATHIHGAQGNFELVITLCDHWLKLEPASKDARERRQTAMENLQKT